MSSNAHLILMEHVNAGNDTQLLQMIQLQILLPETLAQLHNLLYYALTTRTKDKDDTTILDEVLRINGIYNMIHPVMQTWMEQGDYKKALNGLTKVIYEITQSGSVIAKPKWMTNECLCYLYMYYRIPIEKWFILIKNCVPAFQQSIRTFAIYFQVENMHSQIFLLSPITQNDILAACFSNTSPNITTFLSTETEFAFQASPPRHVVLDDDDMDMLLDGPEDPAPAPAPAPLPAVKKTKTKEKEKEKGKGKDIPEKANEKKARKEAKA